MARLLTFVNIYGWPPLRKSIFLRAAERGEIGPGHDLELLLDLVFGAMWYRLLIGHAAMDEPFADELTEVIVGLVQAGPPREGSESTQGARLE